MGNLFGVRRRTPQITAQDRAILQLKQQRDKIKIYQKKIEIDLERNKDFALKLFQNNLKERAIIVLRRKKYMEDVLKRTDKQLETLESLVTDIEYTQIEVSVVEGLRVGTEALKLLNDLMNIDDIQRMMEDNTEAAAKQNEISALLQRTSDRYDEKDLLEELESYKINQLPTVPDNVIEVTPEDLLVEEHSEKPESLVEEVETKMAISPVKEEKSESSVAQIRSKTPEQEERQLEMA